MMLAALLIAATWPDLSEPPKGASSNSKDAALIVGIERYATVSPIAGAQRNANDWYSYFTKGLGVPASNVVLLRDNEGTVEKMRKYAAAVAAQASAGGTVWFVFIGHGAPARDGKDGLLVGFDAQQEADSLEARSLAQKELLATLKKGAQAKTVVVLDACFSGKNDRGEELVKGLQPLIPMVGHADGGEHTIVLTAGKSDQFAGPLPGTNRPAFSYLALGGLRGWADQNKDGNVTPKELTSYAQDTLRAVIKDRNQTPELRATDDSALVGSAREAGPDVAQLVLDAKPGESELAFGAGLQIRVPEIKVANNSGGLRKMDLRIEQLLDAALDANENKGASAQSKAKAWCALAEARDNNPYLVTAEQGCSQWKKYADALTKQATAVDGDYRTLAGYLKLRHKTKEQKLAAVDAFLAAYSGIESNPKIGIVVNAKKTLGNDGKVDLPSGANLEIEILNELGDDYVLRTGRIAVTGKEVFQFSQAPADRRVFAVVPEQMPGKHELLFSLSLVSFETIGVIMSCTQAITLSELNKTTLKLKLIKDQKPRLRITNPEVLGASRPADGDVSCAIEVMGGNYTKRPTNNSNTYRPYTPPSNTRKR